ncbi:MAG: hypothetical protein ABIE36_00850 [Candidatus Diapherotrites archaeon]
MKREYLCSLEQFNSKVSKYLLETYGAGAKNSSEIPSIFYTPKDELSDFGGRVIVSLNSFVCKKENNLMQFDNKVKIFVETDHPEIISKLEELTK